jgi:CHAD domain-containing protein
MPSRSTQKTFLFTQWQNMQRHFYLFMNGREMHDLHQMRIHIKKIHALVVFNAYVNDSKKIIEKFNPIKELFRKAGKIRELQIHLEKLNEEKKEKSLLSKKLKRQIEMENSDFLQKRKKWVQSIQNTFPNIDSQISACSDERLMRYIKTQIKKACKDFDKEDFHEVRKRIKLILNLHDLLPKISSDLLKLNLAYLDEIQDKIGKWNDLNQSLKMMKKSERKNSVVRELKEFTKELISYKKELKNSAYLT